MDALIRYVCIAPGHTEPARLANGDLTVHERSWAFCAAELRGGHVWKQVGEIGVEGLVPFGLPRGPASP